MKRARRLPLDEILDALEEVHGAPRKPVPRTPLAWALWENVAYLVDDARRARCFAALKKQVGLTAEKIDAATPAQLLAVTRLGGMRPEDRAARLKECATIALEHGGGELKALLKQPIAQARKVLKRFPGIGAPGADRILLACGASSDLALESNGLRVLLRLGYGKESRNYSTTYRSVLTDVAGALPDDPAAVWRAHALLRAHGQALCKNSAPDCDACPLADGCPSA